MKVLLAVVGWVLAGGGLVVFLLSWIDGLGYRDNALVLGPAATLVVAGAVFVLAGVLVGRTEGPGAQPQQMAPPMPYQQGHPR